MDKLAFQKAIDTLKTTDCNSKEKIQKFDQIYSNLLLLSNHSNYKTFLQNAVQVLILFCEDNDSNVRISAEENLNRIIRNSEKQHQLILIQIELYHEIKKNGNERSLRICLNLFSHYCHLIKHRRRKIYAQNLIPCLLTIAKRKEILVIETFAEFLKSFARYLLNCINNDHEVMKLVDLFIENLSQECAIKRRCSAQNIITLLEHSDRKKFIIKSIILKIQDNLSKSKDVNILLGTLGLLRLLIPQLVAKQEFYQKIIEMLETCLNYLRTESNHSVINANLEFINALLSASSNMDIMANLLCDDEKMAHKDMLLSRHSAVLTTSINNSRKSSIETIKNSDHLLQIPSTSLLSTPNKSLGDFSDVEGDSFKSNDFDINVPLSSSSPGALKNVIGAAETMSLKSTDSINSFFSSILSNSNTDTVTKFFRKSSTTDSPTHQTKMSESVDDKSLDISLSHLKDENVNYRDSQMLPETAELAIEESIMDETLEIVDTSNITAVKELYIGSIYDQSIVDYIVRLVSSKYLLDGAPKMLINDQIVRVSIKSLALSTIAACVELKSDVMLMKLSKDYTDESMMVESLLSYLVDEDIRLEEEDKKKKNIPEDEKLDEKQSTSDFFEIKENHFGECTTATFLDYFSPLNNTIDEQGLISMKNRIYEKKTKDREESAKKINNNLCELLSRSEMIESKKYNLPLMETTLKLPDDRDCQFIADILMYASHSDPVLRGGVYLIVGNFVKNILERNLDYSKVVDRNEFVKDSLNFDKMIGLLLTGIQDEIHSVAKQTLTVWENAFNVLISVMKKSEIEDALNQILMVSHNKYWLVQCKFCDVITKINLRILANLVGQNSADSYEKQIRKHLFALIKDNDFRVRNHASESLSNWIGNFSQNTTRNGHTLLDKFAEKNFFKYESFSNDIKVRQDFDSQVENQLSKVLYEMCNFLMELKDKNQQFGIIYAIKILIRNFSPLTYSAVWKEFNFLNILLSFINNNPGVSLDISCQCDMLEIIAALFSTEGVLNATVKDNNNEYLIHLLKILNIYAHLINNIKLLIVPKGKTDLFTSAKELALINSFGFFTNDNFYLKFYLVLKSSYDSYRMTINQDAELKLKLLLHLVMRNLQILLEFKIMIADDSKLIEEIVGYLNKLVLFQPEDCIMTTKILLKFLFQRNYCNRKTELDTIIEAAKNGDVILIFEKYETFSSFDAAKIAQNFDNLIKLFDTLVIQGLRLFSKSPAMLQAKILNMLCQLLEFNVNYMQLDSKKVFVDFVLKQLEYIESGLVIESQVLAPKIIEFLLYLTKLKDKKILNMPKIINIIDNLLASTNDSAKECGIKSLLVMADELYFKNMKISSTESEVIDAYQKDLNAQREVALSMMVKFIYHEDIQEFIGWIFMKYKISKCLEIEIDENEIYQSLIQSLNTEPLCNFQLIKSLGKNILLESKNFKLIVGLYWKLLDAKKIDSLELLVFLEENVLSIAEEIYLINHIKLYHQKQNLEGDAIKIFLKLHLDYLRKLLSQKDISYNTINRFTAFLQLNKFPSLFLDFKEMLDVKSIIENSFTSSVTSCMDFIISLDYKLVEIESYIHSIDAKINKAQITKNLYQNVFNKRKNVKDWDGNEIMSFFKEPTKIEILLNFSQDTLLARLLEDEKISKTIIRKLFLIRVSTKRIKFILENIHDACIKEACVYLMSHGMNNDLKILQFVLVKKLQTFKNQKIMNSENRFKISLDDLEDIQSKLTEFKLENKLTALRKTVCDLIQFWRKEDNNYEVDYSEMEKTIDESWLFDQAKLVVTSDNLNPCQVAEMLYEIKSESKLVALLNESKFNIKLLIPIINVSFKKMLQNFRIDCIQINPHLMYMKISPLLKAAIAFIARYLEKLTNSSSDEEIVQTAQIINAYMKNVFELNRIALIYVEAKFIEKYIGDNLLRPKMHELLLKFINIMISKMDTIDSTEIILEAIKSLFINESINMNDIDDKIVSWIYCLLRKTFKNTNFSSKYQHPQLFDELQDDTTKDRIEIMKQVIFIANIHEAYEDGEFNLLPIDARLRNIIDISFELSKFILRLNRFYQFTLTPYEIMLNYRSGDDLLDKNALKLKQIPIEYLSDSDLLERYVRRINRYKFTQRTEFEEIFMTLLVLLNQWNEMQEAEEQFCIKQLCLQTNVDLILSCFRYRSMSSNKNECNFAHIPRTEKFSQIEKIGVKKLHHIQDVLSINFNVFYQPNFERININDKSNLISCSSFGMNQFSLDYTWNLTNEANSPPKNHHMKNLTYYHAEKLTIDYKSSLQLIYDLMTQMIDENPVLVLPQLTKLISVLDNNEQFKWINKKMLALYETVCSEDTISHQYIIYLLCRSSAVLVPTLSEIQQLIPIINKYLGYNHMFVRNATLHGLLCLFESLVKMNTTIGGISDELKLLRTTIINYTNKNGIVYECASTSTSPEHDKLVWTLNYYVIENTLKFGDCNELLIDTIISANNILKRSTDIDLYFLIINGLERLIIADSENKSYREKVEKLALDLLKNENKNFSLGGLKLLVTCMYIGSLQQLENTEKSNGIVQDEPEIIMQSTEKIEILFNRIRNATIDEAEVYGRVLERILKDLLPPNEILTKIIKELLILNQSNTIIISKIIHQVFRTAIDSSFLVLLQDWLICSLPNFLTYPNQKKSILFLTLIFMSSTLNQHLLKLFPLSLDEDILESDLYRIFTVSAKDFYGRLSDKQQVAFRDAISHRVMTSSTSPSRNLNESFFERLLKHL